MLAEAKLRLPCQITAYAVAVSAASLQGLVNADTVDMRLDTCADMCADAYADAQRVF